MAPEPDFSIHNPSGLPVPVKESVLLRILEEISRHEKVTFSMIEVIYVDEEEILRVNREFLGKEYVTDIITFRYDIDADDDADDDPDGFPLDPADFAEAGPDDGPDEIEQKIEGSLYCCAPRIVEQAEEFGTPPAEEFRRIFIHGLLHLAGYEDGTPEEKETMTRRENFYLSLFSDS